MLITEGQAVRFQAAWIGPKDLEHVKALLQDGLCPAQWSRQPPAVATSGRRSSWRNRRRCEAKKATPPTRSSSWYRRHPLAEYYRQASPLLKGTQTQPQQHLNTKLRLCVEMLLFFIVPSFSTPICSQPHGPVRLRRHQPVQLLRGCQS